MSLDAEARAWLAAMVTRIEDDPVLLAEMSDDEVNAALADEGYRGSGVQAAIRRRVREAEATPARLPARRIRFNPFSARIGGLATALAALGVLALASLWWVLQASAFGPDDVLAYETTLNEWIRPPSKGLQPEANDLISEGAQVLLAAAQAGDALAARKAGDLFAQGYDLAETTVDEDAAAFFAGLARGLQGDSNDAIGWLKRVSPAGPYGGPAREAIEALEH